MNEDSVALIIREKCVYRIRILNKGSGTIDKYLFKRYFLLILVMLLYNSIFNEFSQILNQNDTKLIPVYKTWSIPVQALNYLFTDILVAELYRLIFSTLKNLGISKLRKNDFRRSECAKK